jgi:uncharacterized protein YgiM (DUF1202 family)
MKTKIGVILTAMLATGAMAQMATNGGPPLSVPGAPQAMTPTPQVPADTSATTNKPAPKTTAKKPAPKATAPKAAAKKTAPVVATSFGENETAVVNATSLNVRGQAHINSEIVTRLKKGDAVTVIKEVTLTKPKTDEPAKWAEIVLPAGTRVWVNAPHVDANGTVTAKKLNIRTGAGENYSVIGELQKGDVVKVVETKGDWKAIDSPTNAYGFVAAHMLAHKEAAPVIFTPPVVNNIPDNTQIVTAPKAAQATTPMTTPTPVEPPAIPVVSIPPPTYTPISDGPPPPRIVQREGIVGETVSIQAPTYFHMESLDSGKVMDYIHSSSTNLMLGTYVGKTVLVSGEEELDERWPNTPVLTIKKIQIVK